MRNANPNTNPAGGTLDEQILAAAKEGPRKVLESGTLLRLPLEAIGPHPDQPRVTLDEAKLKELIAGILQAGGLLQPINVRPARPEERKPDEPAYEYRLVAGQRRLESFRRLHAAAQTSEEKARWATVPAVLTLGRDDADTLRDAIIENIHRDELLPLDAAEALAKLKQRQGLRSAREVAQAVGMKEDRVKRLLRLNDAPAVIKEALKRGVTVVVRADGDEAAPTEPGPGDAGSLAAEPKAPRPKKEQLRRLDLMEALEFARLHEHHFEKNGGFRRESAGKKADEVTRNAIEKALTEGWGFRRIQEFVEATVTGQPVREAAASTAVTVFKTSPKQLVIHRERLGQASPEVRAALKAELQSLLAALG